MSGFRQVRRKGKTYSRRSAAGSARTKVTRRCHKCKCRCRSRSNINSSKNLVFSAIFVPLEEKCWYLRCFCNIKDKTSPKHRYLQCFFNECVENTVFCDVFLTRHLKCIVNTSVFFTFITSSSQSKPSKNTGICSVLTRQNAKKNTMFGSNFARFFGPCPSGQKSIIFTKFLPPLIQTQKRGKSQKIAKLHLKSTFFCDNQF